MTIIDKEAGRLSEIEKLRENERLRVQKEAEVEFEWWGNRVIDDPEESLRTGALLEIPDEGPGHRLIYTLRSNTEPKYLAPQGQQLLQLVSQRWLYDIRGRVLNDNKVLLSVSSLYRSVALQQSFIEQGMNAAKRSAHGAGVAIDFDPNGYYQGSNRKGISRSKPDFDERYIEILRDVINRLEYANLCHVIIEKGYKDEKGQITEYDACWHVCASPSFGFA